MQSINEISNKDKLTIDEFLLLADIWENDVKEIKLDDWHRHVKDYIEYVSRLIKKYRWAIENHSITKNHLINNFIKLSILEKYT